MLMSPDLVLQDSHSIHELALIQRKESAYANIRSLNRRLNLAIVVPVYNENGRIYSAGSKLHEACELVSASNHNLRLEFIFVDEGSTDGTYEVLSSIVQASPDQIYVNAHVLQIPEDMKTYKHQTAEEKNVQMGGALLEGFRYACREDSKASHVLYTDFDNSVPLWEIGNALPLIEDGVDVVVGSRRESDSVVVRDKNVAGYGSKFITVWNRLFPALGRIVKDTNGAFHIWKKESLPSVLDWIHTNKVFSPAFKTAYLHKAVQEGRRVESMGITFIDVIDGSHFSGNDPAGRLSVYARIIRHLAPLSSEARDFAQKLLQLDQVGMMQFIAQHE